MRIVLDPVEQPLQAHNGRNARLRRMRAPRMLQGGAGFFFRLDGNPPGGSLRHGLQELCPEPGAALLLCLDPEGDGRLRIPQGYGVVGLLNAGCFIAPPVSPGKVPVEARMNVGVVSLRYPFQQQFAHQMVQDKPLVIDGTEEGIAPVPLPVFLSIQFGWKRHSDSENLNAHRPGDRTEDELLSLCFRELLQVQIEQVVPDPGILRAPGGDERAVKLGWAERLATQLGLEDRLGSERDEEGMPPA